MSDPLTERSSAVASFVSKMSLSGTKKYEPLRNETVQETSDDHKHLEDDDCHLPLRRRKRDSGRTVRILVVLNLILALSLLAATVALWRERNRRPTPPYSPAWEAVRYVNKRFAKDDRFYLVNETDASVDALWKNMTGPSNGHIKVDAAEARRNVPTVELPFAPGKYIYGLDVFHQVHCLDIIRKSFFPDHYFPSKSPKEVREHKQHCLDYLRQSIMCAGDVTLDHWFNYTWTDPSFAADGAGQLGRDDWMSSYTGEFTKLTPWDRIRRAGLQWDTTHQCRDYDALWRWVEERQLWDADTRQYKAAD